MKTSCSKGFTLIELLIVVAIIAILAAIAVPNFLEAQTRSKVTRAKSDMRTMALAMEAYAVDNNTKYPSDAGNGSGNGVYRPYASPPRNPATRPTANFSPGFEVTTPVAYVSSMSPFIDTFRQGQGGIAGDATYDGRQYINLINWKLRLALATDPSQRTAFGNNLTRDGAWVLWSSGPDRAPNNVSLNPPTQDFEVTTIPVRINYDASNGTISVGDIYRTQKFSEGIAENPSPPAAP